MALRRILALPLAALAVLFACAQAFPGTTSSFTGTTGNSGNTASAAADWVGPTVTGSVIQKSQGATDSAIGPGVTFYVYGNATDAGNPASGVSSLTASVANIATVGSAAMASGSWTVNGTAYGFRSALLTAKASLTPGTASYTVTGTDAANNTGTALAGSVTVDGTAPAADSYTWNDSGTSARKYEAGETVTLAYSKTIEPSSVVAGWTTGSQSVTVRVTDAGTNDVMTFYNAAGTTQLPLGSVALGGNFANNSKVFNFSGSTMTLSGGTISITLGAVDVGGNVATATSTALPVWTPDAAVIDQAGNACSTTAQTSFGGGGIANANKTGGTAGLMETGDTSALTFTQTPAPGSIISGWTGASTPVTIRIFNVGGASPDQLTVYDASNATLLPLGTLAVGGDVATANVVFSGSSMTLSGRTVTLTLGTADLPGKLKQPGSAGAPAWTPNAGALDLAGIAASTITFTGATATQF